MDLSLWVIGASVAECGQLLQGLEHQGDGVFGVKLISWQVVATSASGCGHGCRLQPSVGIPDAGNAQNSASGTRQRLHPCPTTLNACEHAALFCDVQIVMANVAYLLD